MSKVVNPDFFRQKAKQEVKPVQSAPAAAAESEKKTPAAPLSISSQLMSSLKKLSDSFESFDRGDAAAEIRSICARGLRNRFTVAVVGEFSKGKSTFINGLMGKEILPVGDMPTTAMMTRIRYSAKNRMVHFDSRNNKSAEMPLSPDSWEGLTAENFGKRDPAGTVLVGINSAWLYENNIELMDTPGAGDLEEKRAKVIGEALMGSDGAIITISATAALSMSEKLFIEQRLISRNTPFLMLIVTKLDMVKKEERNAVIDYIIRKLDAWNMKIPVFVPYEVETEDCRYTEIMGMDKVRNRIVSWQNDPKRRSVTEHWIAGQALNVIERELCALKEQQVMLEADDTQRQKLIEEKKQKLMNAQIAWEELRLQMLARCNKCYEELLRKAEDYAHTITERLQYEASHSNNLNKWWNEDYAYRLKVELANMATGIENTVSRIIQEDTRWFNASLEHNFKTHILCDKETIYERETTENAAKPKALEFEDLDRKKNAVKIGTTVLSIAGFVVCSALGFLPIVATMGISTASTVISDRVFRRKLEEQRDAVKAAIAKEVPRIIDEATRESEIRLKAVYDDILEAAVEKEKAWQEAQTAAIEMSVKPQGQERRESIGEQLEALEAFRDMLVQE